MQMISFKISNDIPYNYLIGDDGNIYEGRGFSYQGEIVRAGKEITFDESAIVVAFIGDFKSQIPSQLQVDIFFNFLKTFEGVEITNDYTLLSQSQLIEGTSDMFDEVLKKHQNYYSCKLS